MASSFSRITNPGILWSVPFFVVKLGMTCSWERSPPQQPALARTEDAEHLAPRAPNLKRPQTHLQRFIKCVHGDNIRGARSSTQAPHVLSYPRLRVHKRREVELNHRAICPILRNCHPAQINKRNKRCRNQECTCSRAPLKQEKHVDCCTCPCLKECLPSRQVKACRPVSSFFLSRTGGSLHTPQRGIAVWWCDVANTSLGVAVRIQRVK